MNFSYYSIFEERYDLFSLNRTKLKIMPKKSTTQSFIERAKSIHGDKYDYSKVNYKNNSTKVIIICKIHGDFEQSPRSHLRGANCFKCCGSEKYTNETFIEKAKSIHGDKYDYSKVEYTGVFNSVIIICKEHGEFHQTPDKHFRGHGCQKHLADNRHTLDDFLEKAKMVHGNKYDYSKAVYLTNREKIKIICKKHGEFQQSPNLHISHKQGCPICTAVVSKPHVSIIKYLNSFGLIKGVDFLVNDRKSIYPLELDLYFPSFKLGVEINGIYYHSIKTLDEDKLFKNRHLDKFKACLKNGITLIQFTDLELNSKFDLCMSILNSFLNLKIKKIYARNCEIRIPKKQEIKTFLNENHIQGHINSSISFGLYFENELVHLQTFGKTRYNKRYSLELLRLCSKLNTKVIGGASKLFSHFKKHYSSSVISYCDISKFSGDVYKQLGFTEIQQSPPNYFYWRIDRKILESRINYQKHKLKEILENFDGTKTEKENMFNNKFRLYYDCGNKVFSFNV